ncbi:MAG: penicillin-binding protein 2 [Candidatus Cloacimonetes bacterium]|nr:penicillin-binding protein 2 [Candidatus Cloacimonadota bacterium]
MTDQSSKSNILIYTIISLFLILAVSLFNLQIIQGENYQQIAEKNFVRMKKIPSIRGEIYDRNYRPIAINRPSFNLYLSLSKVRDRDELFNFLMTRFGFSHFALEDLFYQNRFRLYQEILLATDIEYQDMIGVSELLSHFPSLSFKTESIRQYLYPNHFTGHVGLINENEYQQLQNQGYNINSFLGKTGLEKYYEDRLRGKNGYEIIQVDATGRNLDFFRHNLHQSPRHGCDLILSIDNDLQYHIEDIFPHQTNGAIVVMEVKTGGILAYVSRPEFDQNIFVNKISPEVWDDLLQDPDKPMLDRIIHGTYPPGSVYKTVIASLGLEKELIDKNTRLAECTGGLHVGNRFFKCWYDKGHGRLSLLDAVKYSCDVYFYDLSLKLSLDDMQIYTENNFLTVKTGVDLIGERKGFFPTQAWYGENYGQYTGIIGPKVNLSIGQGELLVTPLQICAYFNALANEGRWVQPHFLVKQIDQSGSYFNEYDEGQLPLTREHLELIQTALFKAVNESYGTGVAASISYPKIYGKTGSAENHMGELTHAWFAGYAVGEHPEISFVVFLENAGHGGSMAAPLAAQIVRFYAQNRLDVK